MAGETTRTTTAYDQDSIIQMKLLKRANLRLVAASICEKVQQQEGAGITAYFVRYQRMDVPLDTLTEGTNPSTYSSFSLAQQTVTLDQWGDVIAITDLAKLTTKHPLVEEAVKLLADNAQRVIDREVQIVWMAGTNVQYFDGSVASRPTLTSSHYISDTVIHQAVVTLTDAGAAPRGSPYVEPKGQAASGSINGPSHFVAVCGPQVVRDIMTASTSMGTWASVAMYANQKALYNSEVGTWLGVRWVETNFIPKFTLLGNTTAAVTSTGSGGITGLVVTAVDGGGTLTSATTYFWKVTRKSKSRGFEEDISIEHSTASTATGNNESFTFAFPSTAGYVYNLYFGATTGDANLKLVEDNIAPSATVTVTAVTASTVTPPAAVAAAAGTDPGTVHPVFFHGEESCRWVSLQNLEILRSKGGATTHNPLDMYQTIGYKFMAKAMIADQNRLLRVEVVSRY